MPRYCFSLAKKFSIGAESYIDACRNLYLGSLALAFVGITMPLPAFFKGIITRSSALNALSTITISA